MQMLCRRTLISWVVTTLINMMGSAAAQPMGPPTRDPGKNEKPDPLVVAMERWDVNHDGVLTCDEWTQYAGRIFSLADKNSDGLLNADEFRQLGKFEPILADADASYFDKNHDGRVSRKEFTTKPNPVFLRYDLNGDCRLTSQELKGKLSPKKPDGGPPGGGGGPGGGGPGGMGRL